MKPDPFATVYLLRSEVENLQRKLAEAKRKQTAWKRAAKNWRRAAYRAGAWNVSV